MPHELISDDFFLNYDEVLIRPGYSDFALDDIDLSTKISEKISLRIPIISSPMDTVTGSHMAIKLGLLGGLGIIHRNQSINDQAAAIAECKHAGVIVGAAFGLSEETDTRIKALIKAGVDILCLDYAVGHSKQAIETLSNIKQKYTVDIIAGNIATEKAISDYVNRQINTFRFGMGAGSVCISRKISGVGIPQFSALEQIRTYSLRPDIYVIADGGIKSSGDIVKALAIGAKAVMLGSLLAGVEETSGITSEKNGKKFKLYRGMGSLSAMRAGSHDRYNQNSTQNNYQPEGIEQIIPHKGTLQDVIENLVYSMKTGLLKSGARDIETLQKTASFIKINQSSNS